MIKCLYFDTKLLFAMGNKAKRGSNDQVATCVDLPFRVYGAELQYFCTRGLVVSDTQLALTCYVQVYYMDVSTYV